MEWKSRRIEAILEQALVEDKATSDITTSLTIEPGLRAAATVLAKEECVLSGLGCIPRFLDIFARLDGRSSGRYEVVSHPEIFDGVRMRKGQAARRHSSQCPCHFGLRARHPQPHAAHERHRHAHSQICRRRLATPAPKSSTPARPSPACASLDKYAVRCGGGENHRLDLSDGILIKNNHIALGGGIEKVLPAPKSAASRPDHRHRSPQLAELTLALDHGAESLLLDNMTPAEVKKAVDIVRERGFEIPIEASGGITLENIRKYALAGPDYISVGALTHSAPAVDLSMRITAEIY
jgi:nicotinate-nucleotide pyrophosphorylase (carboxylating)